MVVPNMSRIGLTKAFSKFVATPSPSSKSSLDQRLPRNAATIEPPETLVIMSSFLSQPNSLRRHKAPRWKRPAR